MKILSATSFTLLVILLPGCSDSNDENRQVESVQILNNTAITVIGDGEFYYPRYSNKGLHIFFTSANKRGVWFYDLKRKTIFQLNAIAGAGQEMAFSHDDTKIYFKSDSIGTDRRKRSYLYEQNINSGELKNILAEPVRTLSHIKLINEKYLTFLDGDRLRVLEQNTYNEESPAILDEEIRVVYQNKIISFVHGEKSVFDPFKGKNLIWSNPLPFGNELLVYVVGQGLYSLDANGKVLADFGDLQAARWAPNKDLIAYMQDIDDGMKITGSELYVVTPDKRIRINLTNTPDKIEMYPEWSPDGRDIIYHTGEGQIYRIQLDVK